MNADREPGRAPAVPTPDPLKEERDRLADAVKHLGLLDLITLRETAEAMRARWLMRRDL